MRICRTAATAVGVFAAALVSAAAQAQDPQVILRFSHWSPPQHPMTTISVPDLAFWKR